MGLWKRFWDWTIPDIYGRTDAKHFLRKEHDKKFMFGDDYRDAHDLEARIFSTRQEHLDKIQYMFEEAERWHVFPLVFGTYNLSERKFRFNDVPWVDGAMIAGTLGITHIVAPLALIIPARTLYYGGRRSWWRHESIHARHHLLMNEYLNMQDPQRAASGDRINLGDAAYTVHESGLEEVFTRWQSIKEARGIREKFFSYAAMALILEYLPFMGIRNILVDTKEAITRAFKEHQTAATAAKATVYGAAIVVPGYLAWQAGVHSNELSRRVGGALSGRNIDGLAWRVYWYYFAGVLAALAATRSKGAFEKYRQNQDEPMRTSDYKFPFTYNPVTSVARSISFLRYVSKAWVVVPNYREITKPADLDGLVRDVSDRARQIMGERQHDFTMRIIRDVVAPLRHHAFTRMGPHRLYVKGMFISSLYLHAKEFFS